jgi:hypothetical protein
MMTEYEHEPVKGLPEQLPEGEHMLWQGSPRWQSLALHAFHVRKVAIYFGVLAAWRVLSALYDGQPVASFATGLLWLLLAGAAGVALLALLAWLNSRATVYTITSRRLVMRFGVALPMMVNIPFRVIESAALRTFKDGAGDIPLTLDSSSRVGYLHLWPHVRPWRVARPQPALRAVADAQAVANTLSQALAACAVTPARAIGPQETRASQNVGATPLLPAAS